MSLQSIHMDHIKFCAEECERQRVGPLKVHYMMNAYWYAMSMYAGGQGCKYPDATAIKVMGRMVEPELNKNGYRQTPVLVPSGIALHYESIPRTIDNLVEAMKDYVLTPSATYKEFEFIHPFIDGNGRVGAIIYNWINGSLACPVTPPNVFKEE